MAEPTLADLRRAIERIGEAWEGGDLAGAVSDALALVGESQPEPTPNATIDCFVCRGTGLFQGNGETCLTCDGKGRLRVRVVESVY